MNKKETAKLLTTLTSVWSGELVDDDKITVYHWVLGEFSFDQMMAAARVHIGRGKFFPKPAELLEIVAELTVPAISSGDAWEIVQKQIRKHGYAGLDHCEFGDTAITAAIRSVGWRRLCLDEDQKFIRRDFDVALEGAQSRLRKEIQSGDLDALAAPKLTALPRAS